MKHIKLVVPLAATVALGWQSAAALEFNGYMRAGAGGNSDGGRQVCFKDPGASAKYRLGNECEVYGEYAFSENLYKAEDGAYFKVHGLFAFSVSGYEDYEKDAPAFREWWVESGNVIGGIFEGTRFWAGKRFYRRQDVHINDFYYWGQGGRTGAGFEDMNVGLGQAAVAYFLYSNSAVDNFVIRPIDPQTGQPLTDRAGNAVYERVNGGLIQNSNAVVNNFDMRWYNKNIASMPGAQLTLGVEPRVVSASDSDVNHHNGVLLNLLYQQNLESSLFRGDSFNKLAVQWGSGLASSLADASNMTSYASSHSFRILDNLLWEPTRNLSGMGVILFENRTQDSLSNDPINWWFSAGVRPKYYFTEYTDVSFELGYDLVKPRQDDSNRSLIKATIAPEISAGRGFFARPALRVFATYAHWDKAARNSGVVLTSNDNQSIFDNAYHGWTWGVQAETWW